MEEEEEEHLVVLGVTQELIQQFPDPMGLQVKLC